MRALMLTAVLAICGIVIAHTCCYSETRSYAYEPACSTCHCEYVELVYVSYQELWPESNLPGHDHFWVTGSYTTTNGPYRYPDCVGP